MLVTRGVVLLLQLGQSDCNKVLVGSLSQTTSRSSQSRVCSHEATVHTFGRKDQPAKANRALAMVGVWWSGQQNCGQVCFHNVLMDQGTLRHRYKFIHIISQ